jgi:glycopeptide antibiotics resistance protein
LNETNPQKYGKIIVIVVIALLVAIIHLVKGGRYWGGPFALFWNGYMFNVIVPFGFYFLLCLIDFSPFKYCIFKGILVLGAASCVEIAQFYGVHIFGSTFDPVDIVMSAIGIIIAIVFDKILFPRIFKFWREKLPDA